MISNLMEQKMNRSKYSISINKFINFLLKISVALQLQCQTLAEKDLLLRQYINRLNTWLDVNRCKKKCIKSPYYLREIDYYEGIVFPFIE